MTKEEIKGLYSMRDIAARYGFQANRSGFIPCPFHEGDRQASMKLYDRDFHCHACGANGDIFTFVQLMDQVEFKGAFQILGGTYEKLSFSSKAEIYKSRKRQEMRVKERKRMQEKKMLNHMLISVYRAYLERSEPLGGTWTDCYNALQYQLYLQEELNRTEAG